MADKKVGNRKDIFNPLYLLLLAVGTIVGITILLITREGSDYLSTITTTNPDQDQETVSTVGIELNEVANWKTYNSNNITFSYPGNWILDAKNNRVFAPDNKGLILYTYNKSSIGYIDKLKCQDFIESKTVNNLVLQKYITTKTEDISDECWGNGMGDLITVFITNKGGDRNTYRAAYSYWMQQKVEAENILDQIVSTFKFVD